MKDKRRYLYILLISALLCLTIFIITNNDIEIITAVSEQGRIDLSDWDEKSLIKLTGEWQYYDGLMINDIPDFSNENYVIVPHTFNLDSEKNNPYSTATYRLIVSGLDKEKFYSIQIISETSAYRLVVNNEDVLKAGKVGYTVEEHVPEMKEKVGHFQADDSGNAELLIEVSNFSYNYGGFWREALIGEANLLVSHTSQQERIQIFLFSSIHILGLFFLGLYSINGYLKQLVFFSFICLVTSVRVLFTNYKLFYDFIYEIPWEVGTRIEFLTGYLLLPLFVLFFNSMNYTKTNKYIESVCKLFITTCIFITAFTPNQIYANLLKPYIWLCVISLPYHGYVMWSGVRKKMPGAAVIIVGGVAVAISMLADSFLYLRHDILPIGTFFLLICVSAVVIRNLVQIMQQKDYLEEVITTDTLTGLNNRYHLDCLIKKGFMVDAGKRLYVLFLDLDRFKIINDEYGHKVGDAILRESSKRLRECFHRETDILCRYGGDEFVAFVSVKDNEGNIRGIIKRIKKRFEEPINVGDNIFSVGISIGVSEYHEGDDMEKTIHRSDNAMYEEKQNKMLAAVSSDNQTY